MKRTAVLIKTLFLIASMATTINANAQPPSDGTGRGDKIESLRIAFISQQLNLTPEEAQKFWPVYNQYHADVKTLRQNFKMADGQNLTAEQQLDFEQKKLDLKKKYKAQFESVLGKDKLNRLYGLEEEFKRKMQELREQRQQNPTGPRGGGQGAPRPGSPR